MRVRIPPLALFHRQPTQEVVTIIATDIGYNEEQGTALAAAVAFAHWGDAVAAHEWTVHIEGIQPYEPGAFYKRELPCLMALLDAAPCPVRTVIVDGHTWLGRGQPGLGKYLYDELRELVPVIGIAKRAFHQGCAFELLRGKSSNPLHVTVAGMHEVTLQGYLHQLHGPHRIPTLLKRVDAMSRGR